jgi:formylglycine-generating enzyme required for sulfatase activity
MTNNTTFYVNRGSSWNDNPQYARVAIRDYITPDDHYYDLGVRLVEVIEDTK